MNSVDRHDSDSEKSSSYSSSSSATTTEPEQRLQPNLSAANEPRPSRVRKRKTDKSGERCKRRRRDDEAIKSLTDQVSQIQQFLSSGTVAFQPTYHSSSYLPDDDDQQPSISADISGELYHDKDIEESNFFDLPLNTFLKEPSVPKTPSQLIGILNGLQHFGSDNWNNVRYAETQKQYCSSPGFTYLEANEELKRFDRNTMLHSTERGFAALTRAIIEQNEAIQSGFNCIFQWANSVGDISAKSLQDKINDIFVKGSFQRINSDVLQLACGHRAELIQHRRDVLLRSVKDPFLRERLRKIPPSSEFLFEKDALSSAFEKVGGVNKVCWPPRAPIRNKAAAQAQHTRQTQVLPSYAHDARFNARTRHSFDSGSRENNFFNRAGPGLPYEHQIQRRDYLHPDNFKQAGRQAQLSHRKRNFQCNEYIASGNRNQSRHSTQSKPLPQKRKY